MYGSALISIKDAPIISIECIRGRFVLIKKSINHLFMFYLKNEKFIYFLIRKADIFIKKISEIFFTLSIVEFYPIKRQLLVFIW